jgi:hypothetical protein
LIIKLNLKYMRNYTFALWAFLAFTSCVQKDGTRTVTKAQCGAEIKPLGYTGTLTTPGSNVYFSVHGFEPTNDKCWQLLKETADYTARGFKLPATVHFLDSLDGFKPPSIGIYGSEDVQKRVIYQYLLLADMRVIDAEDPFGYRVYRRSKIE